MIGCGLIVVSTESGGMVGPRSIPGGVEYLSMDSADNLSLSDDEDVAQVYSCRTTLVIALCLFALLSLCLLGMALSWVRSYHLTCGREVGAPIDCMMQQSSLHLVFDPPRVLQASNARVMSKSAMRAAMPPSCCKQLKARCASRTITVWPGRTRRRPWRLSTISSTSRRSHFWQSISIAVQMPSRIC